MSIFDKIMSILNSDIISTYNEIVASHGYAFRIWKSRQPREKFSTSYTQNNALPLYKDKYFIATHKNEILGIERKIKEDVVKASSKYPHAFYALVKELCLSPIPGISTTLPGVRKSKYAQKHSKNNVHLYYDESIYDESIYNLLHLNIADINSLLSINNKEEPRSINNLKKEEYEKIHLRIGGLEDEERKINEALKKEDIKIKFEDEILDNSNRAKYYKSFINSRSIKSEIEEYCVTHLSELDKYIKDMIHLEYTRIKNHYPLGAKYFEENYARSQKNKEEYFISNENKISSLDAVCIKYNELKNKYPIGLPAFEKYYTYDDGKNSAELSIEEIVECEDEIKLFQENAKEASFYNNWEESQIDFASVCRKIKNSTLSEWGCYKYDIPFSKIKSNGDKIDGKFAFWQIFCESFSEDPNVDSSFYPQKKENRKWIPQLLSNTAHYNTNIYDKILGYIEKIKENYSQEDNIFVMFACMGHDNRNEIIDFHFKYLIQELDKRGIKHSLIKESPLFVDDQVRYVVIDLVTYNAQMKENVSMLLNVKRDCREFCTKEIRYKCFSDVVYITLLKGFDKQEMLNLNETKANEIKEKEAEKRKQEEEEKRKERERQQEEQKIRNEIQSLKNCVSGWNKLCFILPYNYLLPYYPTTCDFDATPEEWNDRWLVWNFKNTPGKTTRLQHEQALSNLIPRLIRLLQDAFGSKLSQLTLVCIPAASKINNETRFKDFSQRLCEQTDMKNGYGYIEIIKDATPKHLGGTGVPTLQFDENYFKGKKILLFDDIITKGNSMLRFKQKLESLGATIIAGISIGKTKHER